MYKPENKIRVDTFNAECMTAVKLSKENYLSNIGDKLSDPNCSQKSYWKILNKILNKCKTPNIPPLFVNNRFIVNCKEKSQRICYVFH